MTRGAAAPGSPSLDVQHIWYELVRDRSWKTLALVPSEEAEATVSLAREFGQIASQEPASRVLVINASIQGLAKPGYSIQQPRGHDPDETIALPETHAIVVKQPQQMVQSHGLPYDYVDFSLYREDDPEQVLDMGPRMLERLTSGERQYTTIIIVTDSLVSQARAIPMCRAADRIVLCLTLNKTSLQQARHLIKIVGRENIVGSIALEPGRISKQDEKIETDAKQFGYGTLDLNSKPWSEVEIDGVATGQYTPLNNVRVTAGLHRVTFRNPTVDMEKTVEVEVKPGQHVTKTIDFGK